MKTGEESTSAKTSKATTSAPEATTLPTYPDWSNSVQAYYGPTPTPSPFFASTVTSPTPHPYMWGGQHALMPPYGTSVPYPTIYPPGVYAHPAIAAVPSAAHPNSEFDVKGSETKDRSISKKTKEASVTKVSENGKAASGSGNDGMSQSAEIGSEGSSNASDENTKQEAATTKNGRFDQIIADANAQTNSSSIIQAWKPGVSIPATNLNIGMDLWNSSTAGTAAGSVKVRSNQSGVSSAIVPSGMHDQWIQQDERELKRQKRKQSNRESARRSRLRKQAECEELQTKVQNLNNENRDLRDELQRLSEECDKLKMENDSIKEELARLHGPEAVANLELGNPSSTAQPRSSEGKS